MLGRSLVQQLAVVRVVIDELERCLARPDQGLQGDLGRQLADELEDLARSLRVRDASGDGNTHAP
jgi:hypothetical protein